MGTSATTGSGSISAEGTLGEVKAKVEELREDASLKVADAVESIRGRTGNLQARLADFLDSSAESLRARVSEQETTGEGASSNAVPARLVETGANAADMLERSAMWLRENDLSDVEMRLNDQIERHPMRTLLVAAGIGFLVSRRRV